MAVQVDVGFQLFNEEGLKAGELKKGENGAILNQAFLDFVTRLLEVEWVGMGKRARRLAVGLSSQSVVVHKLEDISCASLSSETAIPENATCISAAGSYGLFLTEGENPQETTGRFVPLTQALLEEGKLQESLLAIDPDSPHVAAGPFTTEAGPVIIIIDQRSGSMAQHYFIGAVATCFCIAATLY